MSKKSRIRFRSSRYSADRIKKTFLMISSAFICLFVGFLTAMLVLPHFADVPASSGSDAQSLSSAVSVDAPVSSEMPVVVTDTGIRAVYLPPSAINESDEINGVISMLRGSGINAVVLDIKDENGLLYYDSSIDIVLKVGNIAQNKPNYPSLINKFKEAGIYLIGRVVCFKDNTMPKNKINYRLYSVLTDSNVNWYYNYIFWMDAYKQASRDYLVGVVAEAAALGFNEIMLDEVKFPDSGPTYMLDYGDQTLSRSEILTAFVNVCAETAHSAGAKLSLKTSSLFALGMATEESGQTFSLDQLDIDYFSPDLNVLSITNSNRDINIGGTLVSSPMKNPITLLAAARSASLKLLGSGGAVLRPFIQADSPLSYNYTSDDIIGQAKLFGSGEKYDFIYHTASGNYRADILDIG